MAASFQFAFNFFKWTTKRPEEETSHTHNNYHDFFTNMTMFRILFPWKKITATQDAMSHKLTHSNSKSFNLVAHGSQIDKRSNNGNWNVTYFLKIDFSPFLAKCFQARKFTVFFVKTTL